MTSSPASGSPLGNKYLTVREAIEVLGQDRFNTIKKYLQRVAFNDKLDLATFLGMMQMKLDRMVGFQYSIENISYIL